MVDHYRWQCPEQRSHWTKNNFICFSCRCYVCNVSLHYGCRINSHKWACPPSVWDWTHKHQALSEPLITQTPNHVKLLCGLVRCSLPETVESIYMRTGLHAQTVMEYLELPSDKNILSILGEPVKLFPPYARNAWHLALLHNLSPDPVHKLVLEIAHRRYPAVLPRDVGVQVLVAKAAGPHLFVTFYLAATAFMTNNLSLIELLAAAEYAPSPDVPLVPPRDRILMSQQLQAVEHMYQMETHGLTRVLWHPIEDVPRVYKQPNFLSLYLGDTPPDAACRGGLLCNERGTGKTLTAATLIASRPAPLEWLTAEPIELTTDMQVDAPPPIDAAAATDPTPANDMQDLDADDESSSSAAGPSLEQQTERLITESPQDMLLSAWHSHAATRVRATLIVVPGALLLSQWEDELAQFDLHVGVFYGKRRDTDFENYDIILTTLDTLRSYLVPEPNAFTQVRFWRLVVDEAHKLLQGSAFTKTGESLMYIRAYHRWGITATPHFTTSRTALYLKFLFGVPTREQARTGHVYHFLRHRQMYNNIRPLEDAITVKYEPQEHVMPEVHFHEYRIDLPSDIKEQYDRMHSRARDMARRISGPQTIHLLNTLLMGLNGIRPLFINPNILTDVSTDNLLELPADVYDCCICMEELQRPQRSRCLHYFCTTCISQWMQDHSTCPLCRQPALPLRECLPPMPAVDEAEENKAEQVMFVGKLTNVINTVAGVILDDPSARILVFTRFPDLRRALQAALQHVTTVTTNVRAFQDEDAHAVLLLSPQTCGVGLNLMKANHVVLCEPSFRQTTEQQAYGRAARIGQLRPVHVHRFLVENTVEVRVHELAKKDKVSLREVFVF